MKNIYPIVLIGIAFLCINEVVCQSNEVAERSRKAFDIPDLIERVVKEIRNKIPEIFTFSDIHISVPQNKFFWGHLDLTQMSFSGLKEFNSTILYRPIVSIPKGYIIVLEKLNWDMHYKANISIFNTQLLTFFGEGETRFTLNNLKFDGNISMRLFPINASTTVDINLEGASFKISGLLDDESFSREFGRFLEESVVNIFQVSKKELSNFCTYTLNYMIQLVLQMYNPNNNPQLNIGNV